MRKISLNNGLDFFDLEDLNADDWCLIEECWPSIVNLMEDGAREMAHDAVTPCGTRKFLEAYLEYADNDLII